MPSLGFLIVLFLADTSLALSFNEKTRVLILIFLGTCVFPALSLLLIYASSLSQNLKIDKLFHKLFPFLMVTIFYTMVTYTFIEKQGVSDLLNGMIIGITFTVAFSTILAIFYQISIHICGIFGILGILFAITLFANGHNLLYPTLALIIIGGSLASARLSLNLTGPKEIILSGLMAFTVCFLSVYILV